MAFGIKINGELIHTIDDGRVQRISFQTSEGEAGAVRISPDQAEINLLIDVANPHDRNLIDMEAAVRPRNVSAEDELSSVFPVVPNQRIHAPLESTEGTTRSGVQRTSADAPLPPALARVFGQEPEGEDDTDDDTPGDEPSGDAFPPPPPFGGE